MSMTPARLGASSTCAVPTPGKPSSETSTPHSVHLCILMVSSLFLKTPFEDACVAARNAPGSGISGRLVRLMSPRREVPFQPLVVFHAHVLHEFGAGRHARERSCVLERRLVILGIGDGYFASHMTLVNQLEALDDLQLFPMGVLCGIQVSHCV